MLPFFLEMMMSSQYWRFQYNADALKEIIDSGKLVFPELNANAAGKYNTVEKVVSDMSLGAFIILANFNLNDRSATVKAAGIVTDVSDSAVCVQWKKLIPSLSLVPHKIGAEQWREEPVFLMNLPRAREFKLDKLKNKHF
ncbi:hypothetical protein R0J87_09165 [Halomonas sp. SIMBA_159]